MEDDLRQQDGFKGCRKWLMSSYVEIRGKLRWNLKCGSAQLGFLHYSEDISTQRTRRLYFLPYGGPTKFRSTFPYG